MRTVLVTSVHVKKYFNWTGCSYFVGIGSDHSITTA